jgi:hypothetical protein
VRAAIGPCCLTGNVHHLPDLCPGARLDVRFSTQPNSFGFRYITSIHYRIYEEEEEQTTEEQQQTTVKK